MDIVRTATLSARDFELILSLLRSGGVIAFPTDTAYGLGADPFNEVAIEEIFRVKGRPETKPILLLVDSLTMAETIVERDAVLDRVAAEFWPGPLTVIVRAVSRLPAAVTAGTGTVGIRLPEAPFALELLKRFGQPITATSANRSGKPSCVTAEEVRSAFAESLPLIVDGGRLPARGGSTLLDLTRTPAVLLREGPVTYERLRDYFGGELRRESV
jgi:L-threonylcarbamoyladenylate synthase